MKKEVIIVLLLLAVCSMSVAFANVYEHYPNHFITKYNVYHGSEVKLKANIIHEVDTLIHTPSLKYNTVEQLRIAMESKKPQNCKTIKLSSGFNKRNSYNSESYHRQCYELGQKDNSPIERYFFPENTYALYDNLGVPYWTNER